MTGEREQERAGTSSRVNLRVLEVARLFLKLGIFAFGGPAAHIAIMQREVVEQRKWMSQQHFLDLIGATNLIPGPNSTEMAIHCGLQHAGWRGLIVSGVSFILPATLITAVLAWFYVKYQTVPELVSLMFGIKPAVIAIILAAVFKLGKKALKGWQLGFVGAGVVALSLAGMNEIAAILLGGVLGMLWLRLTTGAGARSALLLPLLALKPVFGAGSVVSSVSGWHIFATFLKVGSVLFGSGYVLVAYLDGEVVNRLGWLSQTELLDAIAIGQFTPGPVLSTATFVGYQISGLVGAMAATAGIFTPSFLFVALVNPLISRLRKSVWASAFLDAVNASAVGLMLAVTIDLGAAVLLDWRAMVILILSIIVTFKFKQVGAGWIIAGGALLGYLSQLI